MFGFAHLDPTDSAPLPSPLKVPISKAMPPNPYTTLGVAKTASTEEIRKAYRTLARKHHPDVNPGDKSAEATFKQVAAAWDTLGDEEKRKNYDEFGDASLSSGFDAEKARAYQTWQAGRGATGHHFDDEVVDFDLGDLFSRMGRPPGGGGKRQARGQDFIARVEVDFLDAIRGSEMSFELPLPQTCAHCKGQGHQPGTTPRTCPDCDGSGRAKVSQGPMRIVAPCNTCHGEGKIFSPCPLCQGEGTVIVPDRVKVRLPPGAIDGERLTVRGQGAPGPGGERGNLVLELRVRPHPVLRRDGLDLELALPVTIAEAYAGSEVEVPTPSGAVRLKVPPGSQPGTRLRLRGKGVTRKDQTGDFYVVLDLRLPEAGQAGFAEAAANASYARPVRGGLAL